MTKEMVLTLKSRKEIIWYMNKGNVAEMKR